MKLNKAQRQQHRKLRAHLISNRLTGWYAVVMGPPPVEPISDTTRPPVAMLNALEGSWVPDGVLVAVALNEGVPVLEGVVDSVLLAEAVTLGVEVMVELAEVEEVALWEAVMELVTPIEMEDVDVGVLEGVSEEVAVALDEAVREGVLVAVQLAVLELEDVDVLEDVPLTVTVAVCDGTYSSGDSAMPRSSELAGAENAGSDNHCSVTVLKVHTK